MSGITPASPGTTPLIRATEWQDSSLFADMDLAALAHIAPLLVHDSHHPGDFVFREGDASDRICLLLDGTLDVLLGPDLMPVSTLAPGDHFGEMGVLSGAPRAASIRARTPARVVALTRTALDTLRREHGITILDDFLRRHVDTLDSRLREANRRSAQTLRRQLEAQQDRLAFGRVFTNIILVIFIYISLIDVLRRMAAEGASTTLTSSLLLLGMAGGAWMIVRHSGFPRDAFGLTLRGWRHSARDALAWTAAFCAVLTLAKAALVAFVPAYAGLPVFDPWQSAAGWRHTVLAYGLYIALSPVQEFVARGAIQGALQRLLAGPREGGGATGAWKAIFLANAIFSISHQHLGLGYALAVFVPGLFWGWLYLRHGSLVGVSLSHILVGLWGTGALNLAALVQ